MLAFFVPRVNYRSIVTATILAWMVNLYMVCGVVVTKYAAAELTRRIYKYPADAGKVMFGLSVVQAAATLAAVVVGYHLGIFDDTVLNGAIFMHRGRLHRVRRGRGRPRFRSESTRRCCSSTGRCCRTRRAAGTIR